MFKKLKDKIEEEFKQSPLRLSASVQQIAQVISPSSSVNSLSDAKTPEATALPDAQSVSSDFFSICDEQEMGEAGRRLHTVDLTAHSPSIMPTRSRRDSLSSVASDVSSMFPIYESPLNHISLQSEWESDLDDTTSTQLDKVSKEHLYQGYKKLLYRYNKYKGRFMDLSRLHKDLQYDNMKTKNVLQESQDKALRRIAELREQCQLEQKAKAHLEESLRNDLEERDHIINTLNTKVGLLKVGSNKGEADLMLLEDEAPVTTSENEENLLAKNRELVAEVARLKKLLETSPVLSNGLETTSAEQVKEKMTQLKSGIGRMKSENENLSHLLSKSPSASDAGSDAGSMFDFSSPETDEKDKRIEKLSSILLKCKEKINSLTTEVRQKNASVLELTEKNSRLTENAASVNDAIAKLEAQLKEMRLREEESVLTIAENKMAIHQELEAKERQIKKLTQELEESQAVEKEIKATAESKLAQYEQDILKLKDAVMKATEMKNNVLEKLTKNVESSTPSSNHVDLQALEKEKERLDSNVKAFLQLHQEKLNQVLNVLDAKVAKAEGNLVRLCADTLISSRSTEMELRQNISELEERANNFGIEACKLEDLEKELKTLEFVVEEKDKTIEEKTKALESLNVELSDKIDRIVVLGEELEEAKEKHKMVLDSLETKCENLSKLKTDTDAKYALLQQKLAEFQSQLKSKNQDSQALNQQLDGVKKESQVTVTQLKDRLKEKEERIVQLSNDVASVKKELGDKIACVKRSEEEVASLKRRLEEADESVNSLKLHSDQLKLTESELRTQLEKSRSEAQKLTSKTEMLQKELNEKSESIDEEKKQFEKTQATIQLLEQRIASYSLDSEEKARSIEKLTVELEVTKQLATENKKLRMELESKSEEVKKVAEKEEELLKSLTQEVARAQATIRQLQEQISVGNQDVERTTGMITELTAELKVQQSTNAQLESELAKLKIVQNELETSEQDKTRLSAEFDDMLKQLKAKHSVEVGQLTTDKTLLEQNVAAKEREIVEKCKEIEQKNEELLRQQEQVAQNLASAKSILEEKGVELKKLQQQNEETAIELEAKCNEIEILKKAQLDGESAIKRLYEESENRSKTAIENHKTKVNDLASELKKMQQQCKQAAIDYQAKCNEIQVLKKAQLEGESAIKKAYEESETRYRTALADHKTKVNDLVSELNSAKTQLGQLKENAEIEATKLKEDSESKVNILKNEIKFLNEKFEQEVGNIDSNREREVSELRSRLEHSEKMAAELLDKLEAAAAQRDELSQLCAEKSLKVTDLEGCLKDLKTDLDRNFNETSKISNTEFETIYEEKLKKIVGDYELQISRRDERIQEVELQLSENADALDGLQSLRLDLKHLRSQLKEKDDMLETKIEELEALRAESENKVINAKIDSDDVLEENLRLQREEFESILHKEKEGFARLLEKEKDDNKHSITQERKISQEKLQQLEERLIKDRQEWAAEKKSDNALGAVAVSEEFVAAESQDLESTSRIAVAAIGSSTDSMEMLRREIMSQADEIKELKKQHKREVLELGKLAALRSRRMNEREGEDVEHEYLRNILYEYMMGKEQMVLAKVLAAIVKFDHQQTHNILERQSSLGVLRIL